MRSLYTLYIGSHCYWMEERLGWGIDLLETMYGVQRRGDVEMYGQMKNNITITIITELEFTMHCCHDESASDNRRPSYRHVDQFPLPLAAS